LAEGGLKHSAIKKFIDRVVENGKRFSLLKILFFYKKSFGALLKQGNNVQLHF
jgi:hypothetical protein